MSGAHAPPRTPLTLERRFRLVLLVVVQLGLLAHGVSERTAPLAAAMMAAAAAGWAMTETGTRRRGVPRWASGLVLLLVLGGAVFRTVDGTPMVSAFTTFLASIVVLKLWERREVRDYAQILILTLFLVIGAALTASTFWLGVIFVVMVPLFVGAVMMYQIHAGAHRVLRIGESPEIGIPWAGARRGVIGLAWLIVLAGGFVGTVVFVVVPRNVGGDQLLPGLRPRGGSQTGFTDRVDLSRGGAISQSHVTVMEVALTYAASQQVYGGPLQPQYFRGAVLESYDAMGRWTASESVPATREYYGPGQAIVLGESSGELVEQEYRVREIGNQPVPMFVIGRPIRAAFSHIGDRKYRVEIDTRTPRVLILSPEYEQVSYRVVSSIGRARERTDSPDGQPVWRRAETQPPPAGPLADLARELLTKAGLETDPEKRPPSDDVPAARVLESHLRGRCGYTLDPPSAPLGTDPTEWFVLNSKRGHCEFFASALALMCRSVGIEARLASGYMSGEFDSEREIYIVRRSNAHAWVEVRVGSQQWQVFDATPASEIDRLSARQRGLMASFSRALDRLEDAWNTRIASFDHSDQARIFGSRMSNSTIGANALAWIQGLASDDDVERRERRGQAAEIAGTAVVVAVVLFGVIVALRFWRRRRAIPAPWGLPPDVARLHDALSRALASVGHQRAAWAPLGLIAEELPEGPEKAEARKVVSMLYDWGFSGGPPPSEHAKRLLRGRIAGIRKGLSARGFSQGR